MPRVHLTARRRLITNSSLVERDQLWTRALEALDACELPLKVESSSALRATEPHTIYAPGNVEAREPPELAASQTIPPCRQRLRPAGM